MDRNTIIGFVIIAAILIGYSIYSQPSDEEIARQKELIRRDSIETAKRTEAEKRKVEKQLQAKSDAAKDTTQLFYNALNGKPENIVLRNNKVELTVSTKGGTVTKAVIKNFIGHTPQKKDTQDVTLFEGNDQSLNFMLAAKETNIITKDLYFTPSAVSDSTVTLTADAGNGKSLIMEYTLGKDYMLHMSFKALGMNGLFNPGYNMMDVDWYDKCRQQEKGFTFETDTQHLPIRKRREVRTI